MSKRNPAILIVEDSREVSVMLRALLEEEGFTVHVAEGVREGVAFLRSSPVDIVLTDSSSSTAAGAIASVASLMEAAGDSPIALMTGHSIPVAEALAQGFCALIQKPFDIDYMLAQVRSCLADLCAA
jgi:two-component system, OmpR family, response regulator VicR